MSHKQQRKKSGTPAVLISGSCEFCPSVSVRVIRQSVTRGGKVGYACPECVRFRNYETNYGLTKAKYYELFEKQAGRCAICGIEDGKAGKGRFARLFIDHCHEKSIVRGLLCCNCNTAVGVLKENPRLVDKLADYLRHCEGVRTL